MKCITLTLSPAFDKHCFVKDLKLGCEHLAKSDDSETGGKGVNISRALLANGVSSNAVVVLGKENETAFCAGLDADNINYTPITTEGKIRENLTIHTMSGVETRISFKGFDADNALLDKVYKTIENQLDFDTILTFTGSVPGGISPECINFFLTKASEKGCKIVIDSKSFRTLDEIVALKPWLIKPNGEEISQYLGRSIDSHSEILEVAKTLWSRGIENVMISLGEKGAMLVSCDGAYIATPPPICIKSTIGAGDSSIAGFISAAVSKMSAKDALRQSVAYGTAKCLREGTLPPLPSDIEKILPNISITTL